MLQFLSILFLSFLGFQSIAQPTALTNNYSFKNGIYLRFEDFKKDASSKNNFIDSLQYDLNAEENILILSANSQKLLDSLIPDKIWGLCINQIPYIRTEDQQEGRFYFVKLHVLGKISYYYYKAFREKEVIMYVHNPYTGERIGKKNISNRNLEFIQKILHFDSGEITDFNFDNFLNWSKDDLGLYKSLSEIKSEEREAKLFKSLLIYNDRNPVYIKQ
jgi:hypothetical protein